MRSALASPRLPLARGPFIRTTPNIALQRTRVARFARPRSPLNAGTLGALTFRWVAPVLLVVAFASVRCSRVSSQDNISAYQTQDGFWHRAGEGFAVPVPLELVPPHWPEELRTPGNSGQVLLEVEVAEDGTVRSAVVTRSVSASSDAEAIRTVKLWRYRPATFKGKQVVARTGACVTFQRSGA